MGVPFLKLIPVFCSDSGFRAIRGEGRRRLFQATFLHVYKPLTVWIRTHPKIIAGKLIAIAKAISDLIHSGTIQNCARASEQPTLGVEFLGCLKTGAGTAAGAGAQQV
jgi:hypothetical protein